MPRPLARPPQDCWEQKSPPRDPTTNQLRGDFKRFPSGMKALGDYVHAAGLSFAMYTAESSETCGGYPASKDYETIDAQTFASWGVSYVKNDNCGEYGLGNARFVAFADAANATGRSMFISTEPFLLVPNPSHATFSNSWRTTNDINP